MPLLGYGGKVDLHSDGWVIDIKTKDGDLTDCQLYDEHAMQLAAYRCGLNRPDARCGILFVSRTEPCVRFMEMPPERLAKGWAMFSALLEFWQAKNDHAPQ